MRGKLLLVRMPVTVLALAAVLAVLVGGGSGVAGPGSVIEGPVSEAWVKRYANGDYWNDAATDIAVDSSGYVYVTGGSEGNGTLHDYLTIKYEPDGDIATGWPQRYDNPAEHGQDVAYAIAVDGSGNVYVTGRSWGGDDPGDTNWDYLTIKYEPDGDIATGWPRRYNNDYLDLNGSDKAWDIAVDSSGNVYVTGTSDYPGPALTYGYLTIKYKPDGTYATGWPRRGPACFIESQQASASALALDGSGNVYVTGTCNNGGWRGNDFHTVKYKTDGSIWWAEQWNNPVDSSSDHAVDIALDGSGNVYVTGRSQDVPSAPAEYNYATVKYDSNGNEKWAKLYDGPASGDDQAWAIAVDGSGNVYVTGESQGSGTGYDYATIKYNSSGNIPSGWPKRWNNAAENGDDWANDIAVDSSGNAYVTGVSDGGSGTGDDYVTIRYLSDGTQRWMARYDGDGSGEDQPWHITLGSEASPFVYVTGHSFGGGSAENDYATIKYGQYLQLAFVGSVVIWDIPTIFEVCPDCYPFLTLTKDGSKGSGKGMWDLLCHQTDVAMSSRPISPDDPQDAVDNGFCTENQVLCLGLWTSSAYLNTNAPTDLGQDISAEVTTDGGGNWVAVWYSNDYLDDTIGTDYDILVARSTDNGATWTAPAALNTNAATDSGNDWDPQVTTDGAGNWVAVWYSDDDMGGTIGVDGDILVARSTDNGATWTAPACLNTNCATDSGSGGGASEDEYPQVTTDAAGNWVALWDSTENLDLDADTVGDIGTDTDILMARSTDNGTTWTAPAALNTNASTDSGEDIRPQVTTDGGGNWVAVWESNDTLGEGDIGTDYDILVADSTDNGATWSAPYALNTNAATDSGEDEYPQVTTNAAGNWVAVWQSYDDLGSTIGTDADILVARSTDNGVSWTAPAALNTNAASDSGIDGRPQLTTDGAGNWVAVWESNENLGGTIGTDADILVARSTDNGATWTAPAALNTHAASDSGADLWAQVTTDGAGNWVAAWMSSDDLDGAIGTDWDGLVARWRYPESIQECFDEWIDEWLFGHDGICPVVKDTMTCIDSISLSDLEAIYEDSTNTLTWHDIEAGCPANDVVPRAMTLDDAGSGTRASLHEIVDISDALEETTITATGLARLEGGSDMAAAVAGSDWEIGYLDLGSRAASGIKTLSVDPDGPGPEPPVECSPGNVADSTYPISRTLQYYTLKPEIDPDYPINGAVTQEGTDFAFTKDGQEVMEQQGFASIAPDWDVNVSEVADIADIVLIGLQWDWSGTPGYIREDVNNDGNVNVSDVVMFGLDWGNSW
jgi:hypothetical protein